MAYVGLKLESLKGEDADARRSAAHEARRKKKPKLNTTIKEGIVSYRGRYYWQTADNSKSPYKPERRHESRTNSF